MAEWIIKYNDIYENEINDIKNDKSKETKIKLNYFKETTPKLTKITI